jgi:small conductance mechanosensitive channel
MRTFHFTASSILLALALAGTPAPLHAQDTTRTTPRPLEQVLERIRWSRTRGTRCPPSPTRPRAEQGAVREEILWESQLAVQAQLLEATVELEKLSPQGSDLAEARTVLKGALASGWPRYRRQLERRERILQELVDRRDAAPPAQRLEIETEFAQNCERIARMYKDLIDVLLALEHVGIDVGPERVFVGDKLSGMADQTQGRMVVLKRANALAKARVQRKSDDSEAEIELETTDAALNQSMQNLDTEISLLKRLGKDVTNLKVELLVARGTLSSAILDRGVLQGLFEYWRGQFMEMIATRGPHWLFEGLVIVLILTGFGLLARLTRKVVGRAVAPAVFSQLLKDTIVSWSSRLVMLIGLLVLLKQFGLQVGPIFTGLGIAGFALGFALQDTLANFAAGAMILAYHPYDVGDTVEASGAIGIVRHMSLVSTTILTFDNQTLIVPNRKMWGDVIRNTTAQSKRRVDLIFTVGSDNDVSTVERLLTEIALADARVLKEPAPVVKLNQLAETGDREGPVVEVGSEDYWEVYWDHAGEDPLDQEGIKFPQAQLQVSMLEKPQS